jgi:hypothetical protein
MLQRVALGQVRFNLPGLAVDGRGVVSGRQLAVRFGAIDRLVSFFRILSGEQSLDDLQPGLRIVHARASAGTREAIVLLPAGSVHLGDTVARVARTAGGQPFTGNGKHFVQYRDVRAPLGYDAAAISQEAGDLIFYGLEHTLPYQVESELPLQKLLLRLSLQRRHGRARDGAGAGGGAGAEMGGVFFLSARRGLGPLLAEYLRRAQMAAQGAAEARAASAAAPAPPLRAAAALCEGAADSAFQAGSSFWLFRLESVPARMAGLLSRTPGLQLYTPVGGNVAVAFGYRHPIHLDACKASFPADRFFLFSPGPAGATVLSPPPSFVAIEDLVRIGLDVPALASAAGGDAAADTEALSSLLAAARGREGGGTSTRASSRASRRPDFSVPLRLEPFPDYERNAAAALIPWAQAGWLRRLCYALPATALRGYRVAVIDRGILVISAGVLDGVPFGTLLDFAAPDLLVPLGTRLRPAVSPAILAERTGATGGAIVVFPGLGQSPFRVPPEAIEPLERRTLADAAAGSEAAATAERAFPVEELDAATGGEPAPVEIENDRLGPMPLWGLD